MATLSSVHSVGEPFTGQGEHLLCPGRTQRPACTQREPYSLAILISEIVKSHVLEQEWLGVSLC